MYYYVYRIICTHPSSIEKYYYGFRSCKCLPEKDQYWSSSKYVLNAIKIYGSTYFKKKIIKIFNDRQLALKLEIHLHEKFNVDKNIMFFNKSKQSIWGYNCTGSVNKGKTYEDIMGYEKAVKLKKIRSDNAKGKNNSGKNNPMYGKKHSELVKQKHSIRMSGDCHPTYGFKWITNGIKNKKIDIINSSLEEGWRIGRTHNNKPPSPKGKRWFNNGIISILIYSPNSIPEGFVKGRLKQVLAA